MLMEPPSLEGANNYKSPCLYMLSEPRSPQIAIAVAGRGANFRLITHPTREAISWLTSGEAGWAF